MSSAYHQSRAYTAPSSTVASVATPSQTMPPIRRRRRPRSVMLATCDISVLPSRTRRRLATLRQQLVWRDRHRIEIARVARLGPRAIAPAGVEVGLRQPHVNAIAAGIEQRRAP